MLTCLSTCSRHVSFVNFEVWVGDVNVPVNLLTSRMPRELRGLGGCGGNVNVPVNLLTSCMFRELRGLSGCGGNVNVPVNLLTSCMFRELRGLSGWGGHVNVPVHLLTSCRLRELRGLGGGDVDVPVNLHTSCMPCELRGLGGGMLTSLSTCSRHVCFVNFGVWLGGCYRPCQLAHVMYASWTSGFGWGDVIVPVNLLTSCMLRELRIEAHCMQWLWRHSMTEENHWCHFSFSNKWPKLATLADSINYQKGGQLPQDRATF